MTPTPTRKPIRGSTRAPARLGLALSLGTTGLGAVGAAALPASVASASTPLTASFTYTGSVQTWTVPANVVGPIEIAASGGGGVPTGTAAGSGEAVEMSVAAPTGTTFEVYVGGAGVPAVLPGATSSTTRSPTAVQVAERSRG